MSDGIPIQSLVGPQLEFERAAALGDPRAIARTVVGFLNSEGGVLWIGIAEENGIAVSATAVEDAGRRRVLLVSQLLDLIVPAPNVRELRVELVPLPGGGDVLRVTVAASERGPHAFLQLGLLGFTRRLGSGLVPMDYGEVRAAFAASSDTSSESAAHSWLARELTEVARQPVAGLTLGMVLESADPAYGSNPTEDDGRWWAQLMQREGRGVASNPRWSLFRLVPEPSSQVGGLRAGRSSPFEGELLELTAYPFGALRCRLALGTLTWERRRSNHPGEADELHPYYLVGAITSFCELASAWTRRLGSSSGTALFAFRLAARGRLGLRAHSPDHPARPYWYGETPRVAQEEVLIFRQPLHVAVADLLERPRAVAIRMLARIYDLFGFELEELPREVDRALGEIRLPD